MNYVKNFHKRVYINKCEKITFWHNHQEVDDNEEVSFTIELHKNNVDKLSKILANLMRMSRVHLIIEGNGPVSFNLNPYHNIVSLTVYGSSGFFVDIHKLKHLEEVLWYSAQPLKVCPTAPVTRIQCDHHYYHNVKKHGGNVYTPNFTCLSSLKELTLCDHYKVKDLVFAPDTKCTKLGCTVTDGDVVDFPWTADITQLDIFIKQQEKPQNTMIITMTDKLRNEEKVCVDLSAFINLEVLRVKCLSKYILSYEDTPTFSMKDLRLRNPAKIKKLHLQGADIQNFNLTQYPNIESVTLEHCRYLENFDLSRAANLRDVRVKNCHNLHSVNLQGVNLDFIDLIQIRHDFDVHVDDSTAVGVFMVEDCIYLSSLNLMGMKKTRILWLKKCDNISQFTMDDSAKKQLESTEFSNCPKLSFVEFVKPV